MESKIKFPVKSKIGKKIVTVVFTMFIGLIFLLGVVSDGILLYGTISPPDPSIWVLVLIGQVLASFVVFLVPIATILLVLIRIRRSKGLNLKRRWWIVVFLLGAVVSAPMALHLNAQHVSSLKAENAFTEGWGQGWQKQIDPPTENYPRSTAPWMDIPFNAWNWVFGSPIVHDRYQVTEDVQYLENENYTLKLDVYEPLSNDGLWDYGAYPTIMVLHPGSWKYMDKGYASMSTSSQYLAAQGYLVFDLQYGAQEEEGVGKENQETMLGIVRNIAGFTRWLSNTSGTEWEGEQDDNGKQIGRYGADLSNVVPLGRSAGAHLATLSCLSYKNSSWSDYGVRWSPEIVFPGCVAFYSPMDVTTFSGADDPSTYGENELWEDLNSTQDIEMISPQQHLSASSPPVLSIVGTEDNYGLYPANKRFKQRADELGTKCVLLTIKGADHAYDGIPVGIATQMSLWAVERFLQLCIRTTQSEEGLI